MLIWHLVRSLPSSHAIPLRLCRLWRMETQTPETAEAAVFWRLSNDDAGTFLASKFVEKALRLIKASSGPRLLRRPALSCSAHLNGETLPHKKNPLDARQS